MSYICNDKKVFLLVKDFLNSLDKNGLKYGNLVQQDVFEFLYQLLPKSSDDEKLISCVVNERGDKPAYFDQQHNSIFINLDKVIIWLGENAEFLGYFAEQLKVSVDKMLRYLILFLLAHEVEHSYQYLMGKDIIVAPCQILKIAYRDLYNLLKALNEKISIFRQVKRNVSRSIYVKNREQFILERNANVEAYDLLCRFALFDNDEEMYTFFNWLKNGYEGIGYLKNRNGCLLNTYNSLLMMDSLWTIKKDNTDLTEEEKVRYGLKVSEETRKKVLAKAMRDICA